MTLYPRFCCRDTVYVLLYLMLCVVQRQVRSHLELLGLVAEDGPQNIDNHESTTHQKQYGLFDCLIAMRIMDLVRCSSSYCALCCLGCLLFRIHRTSRRDEKDGEKATTTTSDTISVILPIEAYCVNKS